jgi:hypothetical protein
MFANIKWRGAVVWLLVGLPALGSLGCGAAGPPKGQISGTVTCAGKPLGTGMVTFHGGDGQQFQAAVRPDGTFCLDGVALGPARVTVGPRVPQGLTRVHGWKGPPLSGHQPAARPIPARYQHPNTSGLDWEVVEGPQACDIALNP